MGGGEPRKQLGMGESSGNRHVHYGGGRYSSNCSESEELDSSRVCYEGGVIVPIM